METYDPDQGGRITAPVFYYGGNGKMFFSMILGTRRCLCETQQNMAVISHNVRIDGMRSFV